MAKKRTVLAALARVEGAPLDLFARQQSVMGSVRQAEDKGAQLLLFPRHSLMGADAGWMERGPEPESLALAIRDIAAATGDCLTALPFPYPPSGRRCEAIALMRKGQIQMLILPSDAFDERADRLFRPRWQSAMAGVDMGAPYFVARSPLIPFLGWKLGFMLGSDVYQSRGLRSRGADLLILLDAEPARALWHPSRYLPARSYSEDYAILYCNLGEEESSTDALYAGERIASARGALIERAEMFSGKDLLMASIAPDLPRAPAPPAELPGPDPRHPYAPIEGADRARFCEEALCIAARGLALRLKRVGAKTAILGLSGGLDSAMALITAGRALRLLGLPTERLMAWSLPCFGTSGRTRRNALALMRAMGLEEREIDITEAVRRHLSDIGHAGAPDTAYENAQARERTQALMDLSNMYGGLMIGPGDMSELALGFTTYGGDHMSMYGVNSGLYKSVIRMILRHVADTTDNSVLSRVLKDILDTPISPELLPGGQTRQQTEQLLGSYEVNDFILHCLLTGLGIRDIFAEMTSAFSGEYTSSQLKESLRHFIRRFFANQFKRSCLPDGPMVLGYSLSPRTGSRLPSDASAKAWLRAIDQLEEI